MLVRPGQHVSGDGRVYHHYLAHWREAWDVRQYQTLDELDTDVCTEIKCGRLPVHTVRRFCKRAASHF